MGPWEREMLGSTSLALARGQSCCHLYPIANMPCATNHSEEGAGHLQGSALAKGAQH